MVNKMKKTQTRLYKVINHATGKIRLVMGYNKWQSTEFVAKDDYSCEVVKTAEAIELSKSGIEVEYAVKKEVK